MVVMKAPKWISSSDSEDYSRYAPSGDQSGLDPEHYQEAAEFYYQLARSFEFNEDFEQLDNFMKKHLECRLFQMVPGNKSDIEIYIDDCGKINGRSNLNIKATNLFDMSHMPHDKGLYGNVLFTKKGTIL